jgi:hypothetical protein
MYQIFQRLRRCPPFPQCSASHNVQFVLPNRADKSIRWCADVGPHSWSWNLILLFRKIQRNVVLNPLKHGVPYLYASAVLTLSETAFCLLTYLLSHLLTPMCTALLAKLTGMQLVKKFPTSYGTRRFITAFTSALHLSLSRASPIQSMPPYPIY